MNTRTVTTKKQLKQAKVDNVQEIIVVGKLAKDLKAAKKITTLGTTALGILTAAIGAGFVAAPFTAGTSFGISALAAAPIAATTGVSIPAIILASSLGIGFIMAIFKDYDEIEFDVSGPSIRLKRK